MIRIDDKARCCGCGGCAQSCPVGCIAMSADGEGFLYPAVDESACVNCGRCEAVCPVLNAEGGAARREGLFDRPRAVGGWNRDEEIRQASSSGGAFTLMAGEILRRGGVVYGAVMNGQRVAHAAAETKAELAAMRGSKYVQSDVGDCYRQAKAQLKAGRPVLFSGTPCQTAGLMDYLGKPYENLYLVDFICHGVPSPRVFAEYLASLERKGGSKIVAFTFRGKEKGWYSKGSRLQMGPQAAFEDGSELHVYPALKDSYINGFLEDLTLRPSCYECRFKGVPRRAADITLADFWGVDEALPEMNDGKGTSLLLIHGQRGMALFDAIKGGLEYRECDWERAAAKNPSLVRSSKRPALRDSLFDELEADGYDKVARRHLSAFRTIARRLAGAAGGILNRVIGAVASVGAKLLGKESQREKIEQFIRFCMVGATNVVVAYSTNVATLFLLGAVAPGFKWDYVVANIVAFLVSVYWSFYWNSRKVFHFDTKDKGARRRALLRTYLCYGFTGILLNNLLATLWIRGLGVSKLISPLMNLAITIPINYLTNKKWAFADRGKG